MILFSTVLINHQKNTQYKNEECNLLIKKYKKLNFNYIKNI